MPLRGPISFEFSGLSDVQKALGRLPLVARVIAAEELNLTAESIMTQSKQLVPVDTGRLRASGHVARSASPSPLRQAITLAYGTNYAAQVHEAPQEMRRSGSRKYLERPMMSESAAFPGELARKLRADLGRKSGLGSGHSPGGVGLL